MNNPYQPPVSSVVDSRADEGPWVYTIKLRDLWLYAAYNALVAKRYHLTHLLVGCFLVFMIGSIPDLEMTVLGALHIITVTYLLQWILALLSVPLLTGRRAAGAQLTPHTLSVCDDGLVDETQDYRTVYFWPGVGKARSTPAGVVIHVRHQAVVLVPRRAFRDAAHRREFVAGLGGRKALRA